MISGGFFVSNPKVAFPYLVGDSVLSLNVVALELLDKE